MNTVGRLSIIVPVGLFIVYIWSHYRILQIKNELKLKFESGEAVEKDYKRMVFLGKWYPALYLILTLAILYLE